MPCFMLHLGTSRFRFIQATVTLSARCRLLSLTVAGGTIGGCMAPRKQNLTLIRKRCTQRLVLLVGFNDRVWSSLTCVDIAQYMSLHDKILLRRAFIQILSHPCHRWLQSDVTEWQCFLCAGRGQFRYRY